MSRRLVAALALAILSIGTVACAPPPAATDTLDLGILGLHTAPQSTITASLVRDLGGQSQTTALLINARDADSHAGDGLFTAVKTVADGNPPVPSVGDLTYADGWTFEARTFGGPTGHDVGTMTISEIQYAPAQPSGAKEYTTITRLRATFVVFAETGVVAGSVSIG